MKRLFLLAATAVAALGCEKAAEGGEFIPSDDAANANPVTITVGAPVSRVELAESATGLTTTWSENDALGAWTSGVATFAKLTMESKNAESTEAVFSGDVAGEYRLVHPYTESKMVGNSLDIDLSAQASDMANDGFDNIAKATYMASEMVAVGATSTTLKHLGAAISVNMRFKGAPADATLSTIKIEGFGSKAAYDLAEGTLGASSASEIEVTIKNSPIIENYVDAASKTYEVKCNILPTTVAAGSPITITATLSDGSSATAEVASSKDVEFGRATYTNVNAGIEFASAPVVTAMQIGTVAELEAFRDAVNGGDTTLDAELTADIDLGSITDWTPIGNEATPYAGTFDGGEFTISNLYVNSSLSTATLTAENGINVGLFGYTNGATIKNLTLKGGKVYGAQYVGALVGYCYMSTIEYCNIAVEAVAQNTYAGGVAGFLAGSTLIATCSDVQNVNAIGTECLGLSKQTANKFTGGLAAKSDKAADGTKCKIVGSYTIGCVLGSSAQTGGIVASLYNTDSYGCYSKAAVKKYFSGICAGYGGGNSFSGSYWVYIGIENGNLATQHSKTKPAIPGVTTVGTPSVVGDDAADNEGVVDFNIQEYVEVMNASIVEAGVTNYKFVVGTETDYPVITKVE